MKFVLEFRSSDWIGLNVHGRISDVSKTVVVVTELYLSGRGSIILEKYKQNNQKRRTLMQIC